MDLDQRTTAGNRVSPASAMYLDAMQMAVWPREPHGWTFLGKVMNQIGRVMFADWKSYSAFGLLPDVAVGTTYQGVFIEPEDQLRYARWLVRDRKDDADYIYRANNPFAYLASEEDGQSLSEDEWVTACDMSQKEWAIGLGNHRMFREIQERIVEEAEAGRIVIGSRPMRGGEPKPTPRDWWFTDHYGARFSHLAINPEDPFSDSKPALNVAHQLFVKIDSLGTLIGLGDERRNHFTTDKSAYSPYLRLMIEVAELMGIGPSVQPKKNSILLELQARWESYGLPASNNLMNTAASLLREPESQAGRAKK